MNNVDIAQYNVAPAHQVLVRDKLPDVALLLGEGDAVQPPGLLLPGGLLHSAVKRSIGSTTCCTITEKAPTRAFSWLKAPTSAFTFKTLLRHYAMGTRQKKVWKILVSLLNVSPP